MVDKIIPPDKLKAKDNWKFEYAITEDKLFCIYCVNTDTGEIILHKHNIEEFILLSAIIGEIQNLEEPYEIGDDTYSTEPFAHAVKRKYPDLYAEETNWYMEGKA